MGPHIGYIRVSTIDQNTDRQLDGIPLNQRFVDKVSGSSTKRPKLEECLTYLRSGDTLHVHSMDRKAILNDTQVQELCRMVADGMQKKDVADHFGISRQTLYRILKDQQDKG
jgi:DNA invertase Pin-like site-specific DNA recombinase